jgi:hypothetical protein
VRSSSSSISVVPKKRARVVGPSGACITSKESIEIMQNDDNEKLQKKIDTQRSKVERDNKKRKLDEDAARKKELIFIKRANKAREVCHECSKEKKMDKKNKSTWLFCFHCHKWCCSQCLPAVFSTACSQVYMCKSCINESPEAINEE